MAVVLVSPPMVYNKLGRHIEILQAHGLTVRFPTPGGRQLTEAELLENLPGVDIVLSGSEPYTERVFAQFPTLRLVSRCGVGYDAVDVAAATRHGVPVTYTPGANHEAVAEHVFLLLLGLARMVLDNHQMVREGRFVRRIMQPLRGRTLGIIGLGRCGKAVATRALAFGMRVLAQDPWPALAWIAAHGVELVERDDLLARSDFVTCHTPLTPDTAAMVNSDFLAKMKEGALFINTSRGGVVDEQALAAALQAGKPAAAGLDVFEPEPPKTSPLRGLSNVLLSPHIAGIDEQAMTNMANFAAENIVALLSGGWPAERLVNGEELAGWKW